MMDDSSEEHQHPPEYVWQCSGNTRFSETRTPYIIVPLRQALGLIPFVIRYAWWRWKKLQKGRLPFIDAFSPRVQQPIYGVSCGGLGSGSIGRRFDGGFCKFSLRPGLVEETTMAADQFIVSIGQRGRQIFTRVLATSDSFCPIKHVLTSWKGDFPGKMIQYQALYPRSWTTYKIPGLKVTLVCRQISPIFPDDYKDTSLPSCIFVWEVHSEEEEALSVSITFTFRNGIGSEKLDSRGHCTGGSFNVDTEDGRECLGVQLKHKIELLDCIYGLSAIQDGPVTVSRCRGFDPTGSGREVWDSLVHRGDLRETELIPACQNPVNQLGVAVCASTVIQPHSKQSLEFALAWHMPLIHFQRGERVYRKRYTRWFGFNLDAVPKLCSYSLGSYRNWITQIHRWQRPILDCAELPNWYKAALFNELYFLSDGGTVWVEYDPSWKTSEPSISDYSQTLFKEYGRFAYLESWEYRMFNTYDVHFYASFALAMLWPHIQHSIQADFIDQVHREDTRETTFHFENVVGPVKRKTCVPHDLGDPYNDPWLYTNAYRMHDTSGWRDLNLKFVLLTYRDYLVLGHDAAFLNHSWSCVHALIDQAAAEWDLDGDHMIENSNTCDQTYDAWIMHGTSAYCGGLWLAALKVGIDIANILGRQEEALRWHGFLEAAKEAYDRKLWTGNYYSFDEFSPCKDNIMADQLCGCWFLAACGIDSSEIFPPDKVKRSLQTVYSQNVCNFSKGMRGAVNGMRISGTPEPSNMQALEVWTGVTYALASHMIAEGMFEEAFHTASGIYLSCFGEFGLQFQTPEALYEKFYFRACGYMRPLAIWAMQWMLERRFAFPNLPSHFCLNASKNDGPSPCIRCKGFNGFNHSLYGMCCRSDPLLSGASQVPI